MTILSQYRYRTLDVFTDTRFEGNPLAVFPEADGIDGATMRRIARELNLSETVFVVSSDEPACVARLRIFSPAGELPFAGHPTVGAAYVLCDERVVDPDAVAFSVAEGVGPVRIAVERNGLFRAWLTCPPIIFGKTFSSAACVAALGLEPSDGLAAVAPQIVSAGVPGLFVPLRDPAAVDRAVLDLGAMQAIMGEARTREFFVFAPTREGAYSRMFAPEIGVPEDPATGGLSGPLAALMMRERLAPSHDGAFFLSEQGTKMGRRSRIFIRVRGQHGKNGIELGGHVTPVASGVMTLPRFEAARAKLPSEKNTLSGFQPASLRSEPR